MRVASSTFRDEEFVKMKVVGGDAPVSKMNRSFGTRPTCSTHAGSRPLDSRCSVPLTLHGHAHP